MFKLRILTLEFDNTLKNITITSEKRYLFKTHGTPPCTNFHENNILHQGNNICNSDTIHDL